MSLTVLTKGGENTLNTLKWKRHMARMNVWLNDYIYIVKQYDLSYKATEKRVQDRNKERYCVIMNEEKVKKKLDSIFTCFAPTVTATTRRKEKIWGHLVEALFNLLYNVDEEILDLIEGHIVQIYEELYSLFQSKGQEDNTITAECMRDIKIESMGEQTRERLLAIRTIFEEIINDLITKYRDCVRITKKEFNNETFATSLKDWDVTDSVNAFAPLKAELSKYTQPTEVDLAHEEMEEENRKLEQRVLQLEKVINEQSEKLRDKENESERTKQRAAQHLQQVLSSGDKNNPPKTNKNIYQQILQASEKSQEDIDVNMSEKKQESDELAWIKQKLPSNQQSVISNSIEDLAKKVGRLNESNAISTEHIVKVIQCGM